MPTTAPDIGLPFEIEELTATGEMIAGRPFEGTTWAVSTRHAAIPEMISITPPSCFAPRWAVWKDLDGQIIVDAARCHDEFGNYEMHQRTYERMADALVAIREELIGGV